MSIGDFLALSLRFSRLLDTRTTYIALHLNFPLLGFILYSVAKRKGIKYLISHSHSSSYGTRFISRLRNRILFRLTAQMSNVHFACSYKAGSFLFGEKEMSKGSVYLLHNSVDCKKYEFNDIQRQKLRKEWNIEDSLALIHVGRFVPEKNHSYLIDVFAALVSRKSNAVLFLIGSGPLQTMIQEKVNRLGLGNSIKFLGTRNDICELLQMMDIFVMPSLFEGLPVTLVEAQAAGVPCVVSNNVPGDSCLIPEIYTTISLDMSVEEWCEKIVFLSSCQRKSILLEMQEKGFDIVQTAKHLQNWYISLL